MEEKEIIEVNGMMEECMWHLKPKDRHCDFCSVVCGARPIKQGVTSTHILPLGIKATIEKGEDGLYCVNSDYKIGNSYLGGYGLTESAAKKDFQKSILEAIMENTSIEYLSKT